MGLFSQFVDFVVPGTGAMSRWIVGEAEDKFSDNLPSQRELALAASAVGLGILVGFTLKATGDALGPVAAEYIVDTIAEELL